jgi:hypothetical protein
MAETYNPVTVNLNVEVDASGEIRVFGQQGITLENVIKAWIKLPVRALYDVSGYSNNGILNSMFEFWEHSDAIGTRVATLSGRAVQNDTSTSDGRDYTKMHKKLVMDIQSVLEGPFDCIDATPFSNYTNENYTTQQHFGRLALSAYVHYLFGHVAATAAVTNDMSFMDAMLSRINVSSTEPGTFKYANVNNVPNPLLTNDGDISDANIAMRLVKAICTKTDEQIIDIIEQVLGQDAARAMDQDNNALAPGIRQALRFIAGDRIYFNIRLLPPYVTVTNNATNAGAPLSTLVPDVNSIDPDTAKLLNYALEIELDDSPGSNFEFHYTPPS